MNSEENGSGGPADSADQGSGGPAETATQDAGGAVPDAGRPAASTLRGGTARTSAEWHETLQKEWEREHTAAEKRAEKEVMQQRRLEAEKARVAALPTDVHALARRKDREERRSAHGSRGSLDDSTRAAVAEEKLLDLEARYNALNLELSTIRKRPPSRERDALVAVIEKQTTVMAAALKEGMVAAREQHPKKQGVFKVQPTFKWPVLGDEGPDAKEIKEFYDKYEQVCGLCNDGQGMNAADHLTTLESCLRGAKLKAYSLIVKKHRRMGTLTTDPDSVFEEIRLRHMRFAETLVEKQMRVRALWGNMTKGALTALQFEAVFEEGVTELELAGLGKSEVELKLDYLAMVGPRNQA